MTVLMFAHSQDAVRAVVAPVLSNTSTQFVIKHYHGNMLSDLEEPSRRFTEYAVLRLFCREKGHHKITSSIKASNNRCAFGSTIILIGLGSGLVFIQQSKIPSCQSR